MSEPVSIDSLKQRFPVEVVGPFGEVLVIPSRLFQHGWEKALEKQGHRVFAGDYNGEAVFLVRLEKAEPKKVETPRNNATQENKETTESTPPKDRWRRWRPKETDKLKDMLKRGVAVEEIARALGRTTVNVERKIQRLQGKGELVHVEPEPATPMKPAGSNLTQTVGAPNSTAAPALNLEGLKRMVKVTFLDHAGVENMPLIDIMESTPLLTVMAGIPIKETEKHLTLLTMYEKPTSMKRKVEGNAYVIVKSCILETEEYTRKEV